MLEDRAGLGPQALVGAAKALVAAANKDPDFAGVFTLFNAASPSTFADIDREKAEKLSLTPTDIFSTLQVYLGSQYVNDFIISVVPTRSLPRTMDDIGGTTEDLANLKARNSLGQMVPIGSVCAAETHDDPLQGSTPTIYIPQLRCKALAPQASPPERLCCAWKNWRTKFFQTVSTLSGLS